MTDGSQHSGGLRAVPDPPPHHVPRADAIAGARRALLAGAGQASPVGVYGLGGIGKSVVAAEVARSPAVRERFADGVLWLSVGREPEIPRLQAQLARALGHEDAFASAGEGHRRLRAQCAERALLLVLDDVWDVEHAGKLDVVGPAGRLLVTTRNRQVLTSLGAIELHLDVLAGDQARVLLAEWAGCEVLALPAAAQRVAELCGHLPLALAMIGAMVREGADWGDVRELLVGADIEDIAHRMRDYPYGNVVRAMEVSVHALAPDMRERYVDLAVVGEGEVADRALAALWGMSEARVRRTLRTLAARSLLIRDDAGLTRLHDLQRMYVRAKAGDLAARHSALVDAYARVCPHGLARGPAHGSDGPEDVDRYFFAELPTHLRAAGRDRELEVLLWSYDWLDAKLRALGAAELCADYERVAGDELALLRDALRLSSHVIADDPELLPGQLVGRLGYFEDKKPRIRELLAAVRTRAGHRGGHRWLCPLVPALTPPGGPLQRTLDGHALKVWAVAVTTDGARAVSASRDTYIKVWDLDSGAEVQSLAGHQGEVTAVAVSADGARAVSASRDKTLRVWDLERGEAVRVLEGAWLTDWLLAVTADGRRALATTRKNTIEVWDVDRGRVVQTLAGHGAKIWAVAVTGDGARAVSAAKDGTLRVWDVARGEAVQVIEDLAARVWAVAVTADGRRAVTAADDGAMTVWDLERGVAERTLAGHAGAVLDVAVSDDGARLVSASKDRAIKVWDLERGAELRALHGHAGFVNSVAVMGAGDSARAVSASSDGTLKVWDLGSDRVGHVFTGPADTIRAVAVTADGARAVSASKHKILRIWDLESGREVCAMSGQGDALRVVAAGRRRAVSAGRDRTVRVWDLERGVEERVLVGHTGAVRAVAVTPDDRRAVSAGKDGTVRVWDLERGEEERVLVGHTDAVRAVAVTADGARVVSAAKDDTVKIWNVERGEEERTVAGYAVTALAVTADGARVAVSLEARRIEVWDLERDETQAFQGRGAGVRALAMTADGRTVVSTSWKQTLRVWDVATGREVLSFPSDGPMPACAVSPAGDVLVAGDGLGQVHILRVREPGPAERVAERAAGEDAAVERAGREPAGPAPAPEPTWAEPPVTEQAPRRVFVSYTHDNQAHKDAALELANRLRAEGIDARLDQYEPHPAEGWPRWMQRQIDEADFILLLCTPTYRRRFEGNEAPGRGQGAVFEGLLALQNLYDGSTVNERLIPVLLDGASEDAIPRVLRGYTHYRVPDGYEALYRRLTEQPAITRPALGKVRTLPPRGR